MRATKYTPPKSNATAQVSPRQPPRTPKNMSRRGGMACSPPSLRMPRGVAVVTASTPPKEPVNGMVHLVICAGKDTIRMMRPARAGLTKFCPMPPKNCLTTTMAMAEPSEMCIRDRLGGGTQHAGRAVVDG